MVGEYPRARGGKTDNLAGVCDAFVNGKLKFDEWEGGNQPPERQLINGWIQIGLRVRFGCQLAEPCSSKNGKGTTSEVAKKLDAAFAFGWRSGSVHRCDNCIVLNTASAAAGAVPFAKKS